VLHYSGPQASCYYMIVVPGFGGEDTGVVELDTMYQMFFFLCSQPVA
jgi:hypothetical protein